MFISQSERPIHQINVNSFSSNGGTIKAALIAKLEGDTVEESTVIRTSLSELPWGFCLVLYRYGIMTQTINYLKWIKSKIINVLMNLTSLLSLKFLPF